MRIQQGVVVPQVARAVAAGLCVSLVVFGCSVDYRIWNKSRYSDTALFRFEARDRTGYIDRNGKVVIPARLHRDNNSSDDDFYNGLARIAGPGKQDWFIDAKGRRKFPASTLDAGRFSEGLATTREGGKTGYMDTTGTLVIPRTFDSAEPFSEGLAVIGKSKLYGYIDVRGATVVEPQYFDAMPFAADGVARVVVQGPCELPPSGPCGGGSQGSRNNLPRCLYSFIDKQGKRLFEASYVNARDFAEGLAPVYDGRAWGYVDKAGRVVIPFQFEEAQSFSEGLASVQAGGKTGFIDLSGKFVIPPSLPSAGRFSEGFAVAWDRSRDRFWYIDRTGRQAIPGEFIAASDFVMGRAHVRELIHYDRVTGDYEWKASYIDSTGRKIYSYGNRANRKGR